LDIRTSSLSSLKQASRYGSHEGELYAWHTHHNIKAINSTGRRDENGRDWIRLCFVDPKLAEAFAADFAQFTMKR
jgi:hypothetical protein